MHEVQESYLDKSPLQVNISVFANEVYFDDFRTKVSMVPSLRLTRHLHTLPRVERAGVASAISPR